MPLPEVATITKAKHEELKAQVLSNNKAADTWGKCLLEIYETESFRHDNCKTFIEWCRQHCWQSASTIKKLLQRERGRLGKELVANTTGESVPVPYVIDKAQRTITRAMARLDTSEPIEVVTPPPVPVPPPASNGPADVLRTAKVIPADVIVAIHQLARDASILLKEGTFSISERFRHLAHTLQKIDAKLTEQQLPGFEVTGRQKSRGTIDEVREFFATLALPETDGDWFFQKCQGCGWKNNGSPIIDWRATVRAWVGLRVFPSMKLPKGNDGMTGAQMMVRQKELDRCEELVRNIKDRYSSTDRPWSDHDKKRYDVALKRRKELKQILGIQV